METEVQTTEIAILFADIVGSTRLYQDIGDAEAHRLVLQCLETMRGAVESVGGTLLRTVGDAVLAKFDSSDHAFLAAIKIQELQEHSNLSVRIGFHWGEAIPSQGDVYGNAVNIAARVAGLANGNEIVITRDVVERLSAKHRQKASFLTEINVKGISAPIRLFRLHWQQETQESATMIFTASAMGNRTMVDIELKLTSLGNTVTLSSHGDKCSIGRGAENDLQTGHNTASRLHATISCKQGKFYLEDASTNGTYVTKNNQRSVFVHREVITLDGAGVVTTGYIPDDTSAAQDGAIHYTTSDSTGT